MAKLLVCVGLLVVIVAVTGRSIVKKEYLKAKEDEQGPPDDSTGPQSSRPGPPPQYPASQQYSEPQYPLQSYPRPHYPAPRPDAGYPSYYPGAPQAHNPYLYPYLPQQPLPQQPLPQQPLPPAPNDAGSGGGRIHPAKMDHSDMCKVLIDRSNEMLMDVFGLDLDPLDFKFLHCMHRSELTEFQAMMESLMQMDRSFMALHVPGFGKVPRMPLLTCIGEQMYYQVQSTINDRPEVDGEYTLPVWCGRHEDDGLDQHQCATILDAVIPGLDIAHRKEPEQLQWSDVSFLEDMAPNELCHLIDVSRKHIADSMTGSMIWKLIDIDPVQRMMPAYRCYLRYLIQRVEQRIETEYSAGFGGDVTSYCLTVPPVDLFAVPPSSNSDTDGAPQELSEEGSPQAPQVSEELPPSGKEQTETQAEVPPPQRRSVDSYKVSQSLRRALADFINQRSR